MSELEKQKYASDGAVFFLMCALQQMVSRGNPGITSDEVNARVLEAGAHGVRVAKATLASNKEISDNMSLIVARFMVSLMLAVRDDLCDCPDCKRIRDALSVAKT